MRKRRRTFLLIEVPSLTAQKGPRSCKFTTLLIPQDAALILSRFEATLRQGMLGLPTGEQFRQHKR
jgi:hypothetical protein